jgi:hypothetical protein
MNFLNPDIETIVIDGVFPMFLREGRMRMKLNKAKYEMNLIFKDEIMGGWGNGYVGLPSWHPYYGLSKEEIPVNIHGGLTYAQLDDETNLWIIGFDTNHFGDNMTHYDFKWVKKETEYLMNQCLRIKEVQRILKLNKLKNISNG